MNVILKILTKAKSFKKVNRNQLVANSIMIYLKNICSEIIEYKDKRVMNVEELYKEMCYYNITFSPVRQLKVQYQK